LSFSLSAVSGRGDAFPGPHDPHGHNAAADLRRQFGVRLGAQQGQIVGSPARPVVARSEELFQVQPDGGPAALVAFLVSQPSLAQAGTPAPSQGTKGTKLLRLGSNQRRLAPCGVNSSV